MQKIIVIVFFILLISPCYASESETVIPIDAKIEYNNGLDMYKLGKYEEAIACFRTAIRLSPDLIDAYYNLGSILDYLNQGDEAIYVLKQIVVRKPDDYEAIYKIAQIAAKIGDKSTASQYVSLIPAKSSYYIQAKELIQKYNLQTSSTKKEPNKFSNSGAYLNVDSPTGIATDQHGNVYVASFTENVIIKILPDNRRIVFFKSPILKGPISIALDPNGDMYIANYNANNVLKLSNSGKADIFISNAPKPYSVHIGGGMLFVSCQGSNAIIRKQLH